jgi:hypothetical protein
VRKWCVIISHLSSEQRENILRSCQQTSRTQACMFDVVPSSIYGLHCFGSADVINSAILSHTPGNEPAVRLELGSAVGNPTN